MASAKNAEVRALDRRSRRGRHRAFRRGHARSTRKTLFPSSRSALPSLPLLMPSLSHASRMFSDRRDLFYLPIVTSGGKAAGPGAGKGIPAPKNAAAPRPGPPPAQAPAQAPAHAAAPAPAPAPTAGPGTPAPVAPKWGSGATAADIVRGGRPQPPAPQVRPRSLIPSQPHRDRFFGFFWIYQSIRQTKPRTKPIHPTSTPSIHSPRSSPSRASARSPRPPPTEEAVTSPNRAPSPSRDRSEARISKTRKTPWRGPSTARNPTRLLESLYRLPTSAASPRPTRTRAPTTDGASRMRR
jgi:hypothetical protein